MEATLAKEYGLTLREVLGLSWRRLRVLVANEFALHPEPAIKPAEANDDEYPEWQRILDQATGRESPTRVHRMSPAEFMKLV